MHLYRGGPGENRARSFGHVRVSQRKYHAPGFPVTTCELSGLCVPEGCGPGRPVLGADLDAAA